MDLMQIKELMDRDFTPGHPVTIQSWIGSLVLVGLLTGLHHPPGIAQSAPGPTTAQPKLPPSQNTPIRSDVKPFPSNPLELTSPDPLLPEGATKRPLTVAERTQLIAALQELDAQADARLKAGDRTGAFDLWHRVLRLSRWLGPVDEVKALGQIGAIAWQESDTSELRWITQRLDVLLAQANAPLVPGFGNNINLGQGNVVSRTNLLEALGLAYQQVRVPQSAIGVYEQILTEAKQRKDQTRVEATLNTLGEMELAWFEYPAAAAAYRELVTMAQAQNDQARQQVYLQKLSFLFEQAKQPDQAVIYQQQLIDLYQQIPDPKPIPGLRLKMGDNYQKLSQLALAERSYQEAYQLAQTLQQFGYASDALQKLGRLYRDNNRTDAAIKVYRFLVAVEQQAYNYYGLMTAYDQLGQLYLDRKAYDQALVAFRQGLQLATRLKHREPYFSEQIQRVTEASTTQ